MIPGNRLGQDAGIEVLSMTTLTDKEMQM